MGLYEDMKKGNVCQYEPFTLEKFKRVFTELFQRRVKPEPYNVMVTLRGAILLRLTEYSHGIRYWYHPSSRFSKKGEEEHLYITLGNKGSLKKAKVYYRGDKLEFRFYYGTKYVGWGDNLYRFANEEF